MDRAIPARHTRPAPSLLMRVLTPTSPGPVRSQEMKPKTPAGALPILQIDDKPAVCQSGGIFRFAARLSGHMPDDPFEALQVRAQPRARASVPRADRFASAVKTQATPLFFVLRWRKSSGWWRTCRRSCSRA